MMLPASPPPPATAATPKRGSTPSTPQHITTSNKSTPAHAPHSASASPKPSTLELKARAKGKAKATFSPTVDSPLQHHTDVDATSQPSSPAKERPPTPHRPSTHDLHLEQYVTRDQIHAAALASQSNEHLDLIRSKRRDVEMFKSIRDERRVNPSSIFGPGYQGYGNAFTDGPTRILYPCERKRPGNRRARELQITRKQLRTQADALEDLVPIRLEVDFEKIKLRDSFTWNLHERTIPIELFAENLIEDFHLPSSHSLIGLISRSISDQVTDYHPHIYLEDEPLDANLPYFAYKNDEMRVLIKLNISIGNYTLVDQFEWDINNPNNSPEDFAALITKDLALSGEFTTAIAHSIREQAQLYSKYLYFIGYPFDGRPIEDDDLRASLLPSPLVSVLRPLQQAKEYSPLLWELSFTELEREEKSLSREARKNKRRLNRRGGPALPDLKEIPKTHRSQIVSSVLPGAVSKVSDMRIISKEKVAGETDESESESEPEPPTPTPALLATMTRRQRNAAVAAASALRHSATPNPEVFSQNSRVREWERRPGAAVGYDSMVVRLRVGREKLAMVLGMMRQQSTLPVQLIPQSIPQPHLSQPQLQQQQAAQIPAWLATALTNLQMAYPQDHFEGIMRYISIDTATNQAVPQSQLANVPLGRIITEAQPRIRCFDCPGKLYTCGPGLTTENFDIHLKNRQHRDNVGERLARGG